MLELTAIGNKICIIGCSSSGKSTLAHHLAGKLAIPAYHLDFFAHYPNTKWQRRPNQDLITAHTKVLHTDKWIIEGNYSICMPERFAKATTIIWLDLWPLASAIRYIARCVKNSVKRIGRLPGAQSEFSFFMLKQILINYPKNCLKYEQLVQQYQIPCLHIKTMRELNAYYQYWQL
jgi:GTPase SAR1 family protein